MSDLTADFKSYVDLNGLMAPAPVPLGMVSASDNGVMFTSEYILMAHRNNLSEIHPQLNSVYCCILPCGLLSRRPEGQMSSQEGPDDYLAVCNMLRDLMLFEEARELLWGTIRHLGFLNNVSPGKKTWQSFLIRQPQLIAAMVNASFPLRSNPIHFFVRLISLPCYLVSSVTILLSCRNVPVSDTTSRRLGWHLQNNLKKNSVLCYLASLVWFKRLHRDYPNGMKDVASVYYYPQGNNPYMKWWIE